MTPSNRQTIAITISCVLLYAFALLASLLNFHGVRSILGLNIISSFIILFYWINKQLHIVTHYFELRETIALGFEVVVLGLSTFGVLHQPLIAWIKVAGYLFFGLHFIALLLFLIFALTFKMKRLF